MLDGLTQLLMGSTSFDLNANFICNVIVLCVILESVSVAIGHIASVGK